MTESAAVRMDAASSGSTKPFVITLKKAEPLASSTMMNENMAYLRGCMRIREQQQKSTASASRAPDGQSPQYQRENEISQHENPGHGKPSVLVTFLKRPLHEMVDIVGKSADPDRVTADFVADEVGEECVRTDLGQYARRVRQRVVPQPLAMNFFRRPQDPDAHLFSPA